MYFEVMLINVLEITCMQAIKNLNNNLKTFILNIVNLLNANK